MTKTADLIGHSTSLFLRYFRSGRHAQEDFDPDVNLASDLEFLKICWSVSPLVRDLIDYLNEHSTELLASVQYELEQSDVSAKGTIDALKTVTQQIRTGNKNLLCYRASKKVFDKGPNPVLIWTLLICEKYCRQLIGFLSSSPSPKEVSLVQGAHETLFVLNKAKKMPVIREAFERYSIAARPSQSAVRQAQQSRKTLYRKAASVYSSYLGLEHGNSDLIKNLLQQSLILPKEDYQLLELVLAFTLGEAIATFLQKDLTLSKISLDGTSLLLTVGDIVIDWQSRTDSYRQPALEPSEQKMAELLSSYRLNASSDRPDLIVRNKTTGKVIAICEAKFFKDEHGWRDPLRDALHQIIRYSRGYEVGDAQDQLISRSCIGLMHYPTAERPFAFPDKGPLVLDSTDFINHKVDQWLFRITPYLQ